MKNIDIEGQNNIKTDVIVSSYNEWDPLEEVIVGLIEGAVIPSWHVSLQATMPEDRWGFFQKFGGRPFPKEKIDLAKKDLDGFVHILESEGVTVRRPDVIDHHAPYSTPEWESPGGLYSAMPRDVLLVIGEEIIEAPMAWRSRYFEINAYRRLIKEYFSKGAKWTAAPKPQLCDELYDNRYKDTGDDIQEMRYVINQFEPTFDAADFIRCGRDIFVQQSHVTNEFGIHWLRRHLGEKYRIHVIRLKDTHPMHIDASFMPLAPGKLLVNPQRVPQIPAMFKSWDVLYAPEPDMPVDHTMYMSSRWVNMNIFMLDHRRVIVEQNETSMLKALKEFGLEPIPCPFYHFNTFGGSFHCATLDTRRKGEFQAYF